MNVVVIGGGYAGVMAANRLTRHAGVTVTLINPRPVFVERLRLHQLVRGNHEAVVDYRDVLADRVRLRTATVNRIDAPTRTLTLTDGATMGYDHLIYAVGSGSPRAPEHAHPIATLEDARRLRPLVEAASAVTVVGAGPTGIETAAELAEAGHTVTLVCGDVLNPYLHTNGRRSVAGQLARLGVRVVDGPGASVTAVTPDSVRLADGRELPSPLTVWAAGFSVPDLAARSGLTTDDAGRLITDETLTSVDDPTIVAAGDAAAPSGRPYRMGCQSAVQLGPQAAETVLSRIAGTTPADAGVGFAGQCISLGRRAGIFQFARRDDRALPLYLGGRPGGKLKEFVVVHTVKQLADEARRPGVRDLWTHDRNRAQAVTTAAGVA
ncbi:NADH dehydrogenase [Actinoplanes lobatus]|uniref:NADH dehydrogenase n=1 Tax=Actinoplanes lobatus TaxID=113568 RepID=A0A7W7HPU2_9ACTN|nr:FAD-dependent oxidoreductase [Actinoplanes lobatus]MBB4754252.1 NADH dehydrogenase FAD-containing subunit [Actinoplanes lobatus]GGN62118.1 NADH dehydrogenase [Actinoplanes lobatus]GIE44871.1 NADH dehydrogenase [Actinoplanes lobatus]